MAPKIKRKFVDLIRLDESESSSQSKKLALKMRLDASYDKPASRTDSPNIRTRATTNAIDPCRRLVVCNETSYYREKLVQLAGVCWPVI